MAKTVLSRAVLERLPIYLHYLKTLENTSSSMISSTILSKALHLGEVQVRKDLGIVSGAGKPKIGYNTLELIDRLETYLGYKKPKTAVIVGAGKLGMALLDYGGFSEFGLHLSVAFDSNEAKAGVTESGKHIYPISEFNNYCERENVRIGIITVPEASAQKVCDLMVESGICAILNFAPTRLSVPEKVIVRNENIASSLAVLSGHMKINLE